MENRLTRSLGLVAALLCLAVPVMAQSVDFDASNIRMVNPDGTVFWRANGGDIDAGGNGWHADLTMKNSAGDTTLFSGGATGDLYLGGGSQDGDIKLRDTDGTTTTINLEASSGYIALGASGSQAGLLTLADVFPASSQALRLDGNTATISNDIAGNGVVKGWAKINSDGTVASCYNCDPAQTNRTSVGVYEVDFTAVGNDIRSRPVLCSPGHAASSSGAAEMIRCVERLGDPSSIFLVTFNSADSQVIDSNFTIVVF